MTIKQSLENRIRGWFPKEPYSISSCVKSKFEIIQPPLSIPQQYGASATKSAGILSVIWVILGVFLTVFFIGIDRHVSLIYQIGWISGSAVAGIISGLLYTRNQLNRLSKNITIGLEVKDIGLNAVPLLAFIFISAYVAIVFDVPAVGSFSFFSAFACQQLARYITFWAYEKREKMRVMQPRFGSELAIIPKPPKNSNNNLKAPAEGAALNKTGVQLSA